ncbi:hypothetical protein ACWF5S_26950 [Peribacillus butanolivorans]|uniref:hypothetical protein n=1 Tax=Bacillati TaxID=1783272 RepID=UPI003723495D
MDEMITASAFAEIKGKDFSWGTRLAKKAQEANLPYPKKMGNYWVATLEDWELALKNTGLQLRNRESYRKEE